MSDIRIRPLTESDHRVWERLWVDYNAFYGRRGTTSLPARIGELTWERLLDHAEPVQGLLAEVDGQVVGLAHYLFHRNTIQEGLVCYMQDLFTAPDARGDGVGRALIEAVYDAARAAGSGQVYWHTHHTNAPARALYDTLADDSGFVVYRHTL